MSQKEAHLIPKLRCQFAEFLNPSSLMRLRILSSPTCVGLRYGLYLAPPEAFLGSRESITQFALLLPSSHTSEYRIAFCSYDSFLHTQTATTTLRLTYPSPSPLISSLDTGAGIFACLSSHTLFSLCLDTDLPREDYPAPGNLGLSANTFLTYFIVTHVDILT